MKTITKQETKIIGYEVNDGTKFYIYDLGNEAEKECKKYEKTATGIIKERVNKFKIGESNEYYLNNMGCEDYLVEIFKPQTLEQLKDMEMYLANAKPSYNENDDIIKEKKDKVFRIENEIIIWWSYDKEFYTYDTLETWLGNMKENYYKSLYKEEK